MPRLLWLPSVLNRAGMVVETVPGWEQRGNSNFNPTGGVCHGTGGSRTATDQSEINVLLNGSETAPPPIAQLLLSRTGRIYVVASGRCNHIRTRNNIGNIDRIGIEAAHDNRSESWSKLQYHSYVLAASAICRHMNWPASRWTGHKEHQPGEKVDPTFNMDQFRADVKAFIDNPPNSKPPTRKQSDVKVLAQVEGDPTVHVGDLISSRPVENENNVREMLAAGANGDRLTPYYVPNGRPFDNKETMFDYIGHSAEDFDEE